jgi:hypothetical protein
MKVKIEKWGTTWRMVFLGKDKKSHWSYTYLSKDNGFGTEAKDGRRLVFKKNIIKIFEYDEFIKLWDWKEIGRGI